MYYLIRLILTTILIVIVWHHAHWSVALALTLHFASNVLGDLRARASNKRLMESPLIKQYMAEHEQRNNQPAM